MPVEDDNDQGGDGTSGKGLRAQLESTIGERDRYRAEVAQLRAEKVLSAAGFHLVKPDDLKGVDPDKIEDRAKALQDERAGIFRQGIEARFRQQGLTGEALTAAVEGFLATEPSGATPDEQDAYGRARNSGAGGSPTPPPLVNPANMSPQQKIEHALRTAPPKRPR